MSEKLTRPSETQIDFYKNCPNCQTPLVASDGVRDCPNCSFTYYFNPAPCVTVLIEHPTENKILLAERVIAPAKGEWDQLGGFIEPEESAEEAALREVAEESGLDIEIIMYLGSQPDWYGPAPTLCFLYWARAKNLEMRAEDDVASLQWFDIDQIPDQLAFINNRILIDRYLEAKASSNYSSKVNHD